MSGSYGSGAALRDQTDQLQQIAKLPAILEHPVVSWGPQLLSDFGYYLPFLQVIEDDSSRMAGTTPETLRAAIRRLVGMTDKLQTFQLSVDAIDHLVSQEIERPWREFYQPADASALQQGASATREVAVMLQRALQQLPSQLSEAGRSLIRIQQSQQLLPAFGLIEEAAMKVVNPSIRMSDEFMATATIITDRSDIDGTMRTMLRHECFGRSVLLNNHIWGAMLRLEFLLLLGVAMAKILARREQSNFLRASDLDVGLSLSARLLDLQPIQQVLLAAAGAGPLVAESLPILIRWR